MSRAANLTKNEADIPDDVKKATDALESAAMAWIKAIVKSKNSKAKAEAERLVGKLLLGVDSVKAKY